MLTTEDKENIYEQFLKLLCELIRPIRVADKKFNFEPHKTEERLLIFPTCNFSLRGHGYANHYFLMVFFKT